jgi:hypothetical protein
VGDLDRAKVDIFFLMRKGDSAGGKSDDAKNDEKYSDDGGSLHEVEAFPRSMVGATSDVMPIVWVLDVPATVLLRGTCRQFESGVICFYTGKEDGPAYEN